MSKDRTLVFHSTPDRIAVWEQGIGYLRDAEVAALAAELRAEVRRRKAWAKRAAELRTTSQDVTGGGKNG